MKKCIDCNKKVSIGSKQGRCQSCAAKERTKHLIVHYYCIDCHKEVSSKQVKRCWDCYAKFNIGENNGNFKGGKPKCLDCGTELKSYYSKYCIYCALKGERSPTKRPEVRLKMSKNHADVSGKNHPMFGKKRPKHSKWMSLFMGGTGIPYENSDYPEEYFRIRKSILKRDNNICKLCEQHGNKKNNRIEVHHIDYNKNNNKERNLITTCHKCNDKVNFNRKYWKRFLKNRIKIIYRMTKE